jgi:nucleotide-binding universal stress UspA family protein
LDLARIFKAELHFLYVEINREFLTEVDTQKKIKEIISRFDLEDHDVEVYFAPTEEDGINDYIYDTDPDLVAMCTHGRTGLAHFLVGSIAENVSAYADVPVLTYNIKKRLLAKSGKPITREKIVWSQKSWEKA